MEGPLDAAKLQDVIRGIVVPPRNSAHSVSPPDRTESPFSGDSGDSRLCVADRRSYRAGRVRTAREAPESRQQPRRRIRSWNKVPLLHVVLAALAPQKHALVLSLPALCADLRAMQNLANEIGRAYADGFDETDEVMQYADVAEWQQELLASDDTKPGRDYWRDYCRKIDFSALDSVLSAFERKSPADFSPDVVVKQVEVPQLASRTNATLQDFLLACWQVFLSRMTGRPGVTVGCQFDGRNYSELANSLGALAKYLPLESACSDTTTFNDLLEQVQRDTADFRNWQDSFSWSNAGLPAGLEQGPILPWLSILPNSRAARSSVT